METTTSKYSWIYFVFSILCTGVSLLSPFLKMTGTTFMENFVIAFTGVSAIRILNLLDLKFPDYLLLFSGTFTAITQSFVIINASIFSYFCLFRSQRFKTRTAERQSFIHLAGIYPVFDQSDLFKLYLPGIPAAVLSDD